MDNDDITPSSGNSAIVRAATQDDIPAMAEVWTATFGDNFHGGAQSSADYLVWAVSENPDLVVGTEWAYVAEREGELVAVWLSIPFNLHIDQSPYKARWLASTAVSPNGQRQGLGSKLYRHITSKDYITVGVGVVDASRALYVKEGASFVRADTFWERPISTRQTFRQGLGHLVRGHFESSVRFFLSGVRRVKASIFGKFTNLSIEAVQEFTSEVENLVAEMNQVFKVLTPRTVERLNWTLRNPRHRSHAVVLRKQGVVYGLAIVRSDGMLLDFIAKRNDPHAAVKFLQLLGHWGRDHGIGKLSGIVPNAYKNIYTSAGFVKNHSVDFGLFFAPTGDPKIDNALKSSEDWYFSMSESDLFSYRLDPD